MIIGEINIITALQIDIQYENTHWGLFTQIYLFNQGGIVRPCFSYPWILWKLILQYSRCVYILTLLLWLKPLQVIERIMSLGFALQTTCVSSQGVLKSLHSDRNRWREKTTTANVKCLLAIQNKLIFWGLDGETIDSVLSYGSIRSCSVNRTFLETPFYTLIDVLKNLKWGFRNSRTVSRQKQEPVVSQSIETSLLGSQASNLLGCSCEGHTFYHSTCSQWYIQAAPGEAQRHAHTTTTFNTPGIRPSCSASVCKLGLTRCLCYFLSLSPCFCLAPYIWDFSHVCQDASLAADKGRKLMGENSGEAEQQGRC